MEDIHDTDDSCHKGNPKPEESPDSRASTGKAPTGAKGRELCYRKKAGPQLPALESQAGGDRVSKGPDHSGQPFNGTCLQQLKPLEDQTRGDPKHGEAAPQWPTLCKNPNTEDRYSRKPSYKEADFQRARPYDREGHVIQDKTLAGQEYGSLAPRRTKPPKSQAPSASNSSHETTNEPTQEGWENQRVLLWT